MVKFISSGLKDLSISRLKGTCNWGIQVPKGEAASEADHVVYVWLDALSNYLSGTMYIPIGNETRSCGEGLYNHHRWPPDVQVIGKDILKFHAVYWPAFLMALDVPLPKKLLVHGWWTKNRAKISKSTGNTFCPVKKSQEYGLDAVKIICSEKPVSLVTEISRMLECKTAETENWAIS